MDLARLAQVPDIRNSWSQRFGGAALVTGASSGIGEAFAWALAERGMNLILVAREGERLEILAQTLETKFSIRAVPMAVDLADSNIAQILSAGIKAAGLTVGLLVNNAGYGLFGDFIRQNPAEQAGMIDVNCRAPVALTREFAPAMVVRGRGGIIFVASTAAYQPTPFFSVYAATKVFDLFLGEALWAELQEHGVEVLALSPGHVPTRFQARSGDPVTHPPGGVSSPEEIVANALLALGQKPSIISGRRNGLVAALVQLLPRTMVMHATMRYFKSLKPTVQPIRASVIDKRATSSGDGRFARSVVRLIAAFLAVSFIDLVVCSLLTHKLRFWFPAWIDAHWDSRPNSYVTYSQSYLAGIIFIPVLAAALVREFIPRAATVKRTVIGAGTVAVFAFIAWWKGGLMLKYHRQWEALAWVALTAITWGLIRLGEELPSCLKHVSPGRLAIWLMRGVSILILIMAVADPVICIGVQGLPWSIGIWLEVGFLGPSGIILWAVAHRLSIKTPASLS
jgi:short-subunit dehydrogenase